MLEKKEAALLSQSLAAFEPAETDTNSKLRLDPALASERSDKIDKFSASTVGDRRLPVQSLAAFVSVLPDTNSKLWLGPTLAPESQSRQF